MIKARILDELITCMCTNCHGEIFFESFQNTYDNVKMYVDKDFIELTRSQYESNSVQAKERPAIPTTLEQVQAWWRWYLEKNASHAELAGFYCGILYNREDEDELDYILKLLRRKGRL